MVVMPDAVVAASWAGLKAYGSVKSSTSLRGSVMVTEPTLMSQRSLQEPATDHVEDGRLVLDGDAQSLGDLSRRHRR